MSSVDDIDSVRLLEVAQQAALNGGRMARQLLERPRSVSSKGRRDIVTDADIAVQALITQQIRAAFPNHGFMPEEANSDLPTEGPVLWIIDPIDGTTNYSRDLPIFAVSIAAIRNSSPEPAALDDVLAGVIYDPMHEELFTAVAGGQFFANDREVRVSSIKTLAEAIVGIDWSFETDIRQRNLEVTANLVHDVDVLRTIGSAALALAWVAAGRTDGYINFSLKPWDVAAAGLMIQLAGGTITGVEGEPLLLEPQGLACLASNTHLHQLLTARLQRPYA
jgi:myo-inositol-1(or 4)-monophosphatase